MYRDRAGESLRVDINNAQIPIPIVSKSHLQRLVKTGKRTSYYLNSMDEKERQQKLCETSHGRQR